MKTMRTPKPIILAVLLTLLSVFKLFAQEGMEDVVYLKNGNVYRGIIIEQVPNVSLKIQTIGGNVFAVQISDVAKITKENKVNTGGDEHPYPGQYWHHGPFGWHGRDSTSREFHYRRRGQFLTSELLVENLQGGFHIIPGYKFNQFAYLGIGFGADFVLSTPSNGIINNLSRTALSGTYMPLFLYYAGDILKRRITPYYAVEAGYALERAGSVTDLSAGFTKPYQGGVMGAGELGLKFNARHSRVFGTLAAVMDFKNVTYSQTNTYTNNGGIYSVTTRQNTTLLFPGIRAGVGGF